MQTVNTEYILNLGCQLGYKDRDLPGGQNSLVILDFNYPTYSGGSYGAGLFVDGPASRAAITTAVEFFASGYYNCVAPDRYSTLTIGIGTNNCNPLICPGSLYGDQYYNHGQAWAQLVNDVGSYLVTYGLFPQVQAFGASDMEVGWYDPYTTKIWVDGYNSFNNWPLINYGDAQGCPQSRLGFNGSCANGWYQETIWYLSAAINSSMPTPLIYSNDWANARQWYSLSAYALDFHGGKLNIGGAITQSLACSQVGCNV